MTCFRSFLITLNGPSYGDSILFLTLSLLIKTWSQVLRLLGIYTCFVVFLVESSDGLMFLKNRLSCSMKLCSFVFSEEQMDKSKGNLTFSPYRSSEGV